MDIIERTFSLLWADSEHYTPPKVGFYYISNIVLAVISLATAIVVGIIMVKTMSIVRHSDLVIPAMLVFLNLSLLGSTLYFTWSNYRVFSHPWPD